MNEYKRKIKIIVVTKQGDDDLKAIHECLSEYADITEFRSLGTIFDNDTED